MLNLTGPAAYPDLRGVETGYAVSPVEHDGGRLLLKKRGEARVPSRDTPLLVPGQEKQDLTVGGNMIAGHFHKRDHWSVPEIATGGRLIHEWSETKR